MTFGEKLQKLRARAGLSQDQLAELLDVSRQAVSKWERDEAMPEAEKLVRISRQFGVSTDYLLLEELEEPETASVPAPAAGLWGRIKQWYRNRGYLLAWVLAAWGIWRLGDTVVRLIRSYLTLNKVPELNLEKYLVNSFVPEIVPAALLLVTAVVLALLGRRLAGRFRWYHLGWLLVLVGVLGTGSLLPEPLRFLGTGPVWSIVNALLWLWSEREPEAIWEFLWGGFWEGDLYCLLTSALGLAILILGRWRGRKNLSAKTE